MRSTVPAQLALLGCGLIGQEHLRAWRSVDAAAPGTFAIAAVCDSNLTLAQRAADEVSCWQRLRPAIFTNYTAMLAESTLNGLDICLPVHLHEPAACAAFDHGAHVLVEKPLASTIVAAKRMIEAARRSHRVLSLAENHRRSLAIRTARWVLQDRKAIGEPQILHAQRSRYQPPTLEPWHWRADRRLGGGGWAIDNGAHLLDALRYLFGPVESVSAFAKRTADQPLSGGPTVLDQREDLLAGLLRFSNGMVGVLSVTSRLPGNDYFHFSIQGTSGALVCQGGQLFHAPLPDAQIRDARGRLRRLDSYTDDFLASLSVREYDRFFPYGLREDFPIECAEFLRSITHGESIEIDGASALETLATSLAFYESAISRQTVLVSEIAQGKVHAYQDTIDGADPKPDIGF